MAREDSEGFNIPLEPPTKVPAALEVVPPREPAAAQAVHAEPIERGDVQSTATGGTVATRGFAQMFGLDPRAAAFFVLVDLLLFGGEWATLGLLMCVSPLVGGVVGFITYKMQRAWFHDTHESALIKSLVVGLLTAIPLPVTPLIAVPGAALGVTALVRKKRATK